MARGRPLDAPLTGIWSTIRFSAGMLILTGVFVVAHGLVLVHELTGAHTPETEHS